MHLFIFHSMFPVFIIVRSMHQQVTKCLQIRRGYNYFCSETTQIVTNTVLKEGLIMGRNLLRHASLSLYNHFDTHETQHHDTIFNNSIDIRIV